MHVLSDKAGRKVGMYEEIKRYGADAKFEPLSAGEEIDAKVRKLRAQHPGLSYTDAYRAVLADPENATLKIAYAQESGGVRRA
jgi:hypothetical protein